MNITTFNTLIFTKQGKDGKTHYRASLSTKDKDGEYDFAYIDVKMPKGTQLENKSKINITKGFLSFYNYKDKEGNTKTIWYVVVMEYTRPDTEVNVIHNITQEELDDLPLPF